MDMKYEHSHMDQNLHGMFKFVDKLTYKWTDIKKLHVLFISYGPSP